MLYFRIVTVDELLSFLSYIQNTWRDRSGWECSLCPREMSHMVLSGYDGRKMGYVELSAADCS